jgi:RimJ/RimL family protein N-acetyltransferase
VPPVCQTPRLQLRRLTLDDAPFMLRLVNEPSFHEFIGDRGVRSLEDAEQYLKNGALASYLLHGFGLYLVTRRDDGTALGICGLIRRDGLEDADIGFALLPAFWGSGYAAEAAEAVVQHARDDIGLARLAAIASPGNARSIHLLERLGLRFARQMQLSTDASVVSLYLRDL